MARSAHVNLTSCEANRCVSLHWCASLSASGGLTQLGPLGEDPKVVALPHHRQPCHELLLRDAVRLRVDACPFLANDLNEVECLLSEAAVGLDGEGREGVSLALCKVLVLRSLFFFKDCTDLIK